MRRWLWIPAFLIGVPVLGLGIPFAWVWAASQVQPTQQGISGFAVLVLAGGIFVSYLLVALVAHAVNPRPAGARRRPASWNEPMSGARRRDRDAATSVETFFVSVTMVVACAADVYLIFFAHPGVPAGP